MVIFWLIHLATSCRWVGFGGCRPLSGVILSYEVVKDVPRETCHQLCLNQVTCTGVEYFPNLLRCQLQDFPINHSVGSGPVECFDCTALTTSTRTVTNTPTETTSDTLTRTTSTKTSTATSTRTASTTLTRTATSVTSTRTSTGTASATLTRTSTKTTSDTLTRTTTLAESVMSAATIMNCGVPALPIEDIGPLSGRPGDAILFQLSGGRVRREANDITCVFHHKGDIFSYSCANGQCSIPADAPKSTFSLTFCNQLDCNEANTSSLQYCIENTFPRTDYAISYTSRAEKNVVLPQDDLNAITWTYISLMCLGLAIVTLVALPRWRQMTRSKNQWSNMFVYAAKIGIIIYALADPRQGKILSSTAFVGILSNIHDIMETWWEFRRDPGSLYLHVNDDTFLTPSEINLKEKFGRVTERLALVSYGILVSSIIGLLISHYADGQCSVLAVEECESNAGEIWFMWIGFVCALVEIVVEDDIYRIEVEHILDTDGFDQRIVDQRTRLKKIRQRVYAASLFLACILGSAISVEVHEFMGNVIMVGMVGFQRWIKIQVTNSLTQNLKKRRRSVNAGTKVTSL